MSADKYRVLPGNTFDLGGGKTAGAGDVIELSPDVAAVHAHRVEPVQTAAPDVDQADLDA